MEKLSKKDRASFYVQRWEKMKAARSVWDSHYQELSDYFLPRKDNITHSGTPGEKKSFELKDGTGIRAAERFASGLYDYMSPPNKNWFLLSAPLGTQEESEYTQALSEATNRVHEAIAISNFGLEVYETYMDIGVFGTGNMYVDSDPAWGLLFSNRHISEYCCSENSKGLIDTVYRKFKFTARQAVQEFGIENVSEDVKRAYENNNGKDRDKEFSFLHISEPRAELEIGKKDKLNMPIASVWVDIKAKKIVDEGGYRKQRYMVCRFMKSSNEIMGRGQAMLLLPDAKMLNKLCELVIVGADKTINPAILAPDDGFLGTVRTAPNSIMYYRAGLDSNKKPEPFNSGARVDIGMEMINEWRNIIKDGFYNDLFLILSDDKTRTATEVMEIAQEKLNLLGPNFGRLKTELFDPMIEVCVDILNNQGILPVLPDGRNYYQIEYVSKLALAMKYAQINAARNTMAIVSPLGEIDPSVWDNYNLDEISRGIGEYSGIPNKWLRSKSEIEDIRSQRAEMMQAQQAAAMAAEGAEKIPKLQKQTEKGSPLEQIEEMAGAGA